MMRAFPFVVLVSVGAFSVSGCSCNPCNAASCANGCCDQNGECQVSQASWECGTGGTACANCEDTAEICQCTNLVNGTCQSSACFQPFAGSYTVSQTVTLTPNGGTAQTAVATNVRMTITQLPDETTLTVEMPSGSTTGCTVPASIATAATFALGSATCNSFAVVTGCSEGTFSYSGGTGTLSDVFADAGVLANLSITSSGTYSQSNCSGGATSSSGTFTATVAGTHN
jgi:hypothetical protein